MRRHVTYIIKKDQIRHRTKKRDQYAYKSRHNIRMASGYEITASLSLSLSILHLNTLKDLAVPEPEYSCQMVDLLLTEK